MPSIATLAHNRSASTTSRLFCWISVRTSNCPRRLLMMVLLVCSVKPSYRKILRFHINVTTVDLVQICTLAIMILMTVPNGKDTITIFRWSLYTIEIKSRQDGLPCFRCVGWGFHEEKEPIGHGRVVPKQHEPSKCKGIQSPRAAWRKLRDNSRKFLSLMWGARLI